MTTRAARERTAMQRTALSRPVARAYGDGLITEQTTVFDYGCGRGGDVTRLRKLGIQVDCFDPSFFPENEVRPARVVNLGYVVNVVENEAERAKVLGVAWALTEGVLVVSARLQAERHRIEAGKEHGDGLLTGLGTFQKFFTQNELRDWIESTLDIKAIAAEPGIFYVFRDPTEAEAYLLTRVTKSRPRLRRSDAVFEEHHDLFVAFMDCVEEYGRLPREGEFARESELCDKIGTPRQAFRVVKAVTDEERWDRVRIGRYDELLVYLALSRFQRRPRLSDLPSSLQADIKDFFGSYRAACDQGDRALFAIGDQERLAEAIAAARVGKRTPSALYVHVSALGWLPTTLRILEGCARALVGAVEDATVIKFDSGRPRVAYLEYPDFDSDAHPTLRGAYSADLRTLRSDYHDFSDRVNPPILHRKERFVAGDYGLRDRFALLTRQEERAGLYRDPSRIGTLHSWRELVEAAGYTYKGHRLVRA